MRGDRSQRGGAGEVTGTVITNSGPANFALLLQVEQGAPSFLDFFVGLRPVDLVQVNAVHLQALERTFDFLENLFAIGVAIGETHLVGQHAALGGDDHLAAGPLLHRASDHLLGFAEAVGVRRVDPVDAAIERLMNGSDGVRVLLRSPAHAPVIPANGPSTEPDGREFEIAVAQLAFLHGRRVAKGGYRRKSRRMRLMRFPLGPSCTLHRPFLPSFSPINLRLPLASSMKQVT